MAQKRKEGRRRSKLNICSQSGSARREKQGAESVMNEEIEQIQNKESVQKVKE